MKYYKNEQWNDLKVKVSDTLPKGTEVDYNGTTVPYGWEEVEDYSTSEIKTGKKWIDGKPIYRKVIVNTISTKSSDVTFSNGSISNLDVLISMNIMIKNIYNNYFSIPYTNPNNTLTDGIGAYYHATNGLTIRMGNMSVSNSPIFAILEYTKTTD